MLCHIVDKLSGMGDKGRQLSQSFSIVVFEKKGVFGPGLPHNEQYVLPFHITNMCAKEMGVRCDKPSDFQDWVQQNQETLENNYSELTPASASGDGHWEHCYHYPRAVMGEYLKSRFEDSIETARNLGISVKLYANCEVTDLFEDDERICLTINGTSGNSSTVCKVDDVLLATGHWFEPSKTENYFPSPWPASELLAAIPAGERVGVIGSSLSAIEVALTLTSDGRYARQPSGELRFIPSNSPRRLTLYSRNGLLPRVRGRIGQRPNLYLTCSNIHRLIKNNPRRLTLLSVFELLDLELTASYGSRTDWQQIISPSEDAVQFLRQSIKEAQRGDGPEGELGWQTLLFEIFPVVRDLYLNLTLAERERFDRRFSTLFFMHAATQPIINGEKLLALMQAGIVSIVKLGNDYRFECNGANGQFEFVYAGPQGDILQDAYTYVVNARGQNRSLESDTAMLAHNLLKRGLVQIEENQVVETEQSFSYKTGSIVVDSETHQVIQPGAGCLSLPSLPVFAVGAMTRGQMIDASMAYGIARSTSAVADGLIARLLRKNDL